MTINHQSEELSAEAEVNVWQDQAGRTSLNVYEKSSVKEGKLLLSSQIIYNLENSYLFNLGFKNLQLVDKEKTSCWSPLYTLGVYTKLNHN